MTADSDTRGALDQLRAVLADADAGSDDLREAAILVIDAVDRAKRRHTAPRTRGSASVEAYLPAIGDEPPPHSPNLDVYAERSVRTIEEGCLERMVLFSEWQLRTGVSEYVEHYDRGKPPGSRKQDHRVDLGSGGEGEVQCRQRLGGLLLYYYRDAA